jgi:hypothetical protein
LTREHRHSLAALHDAMPLSRGDPLRFVALSSQKHHDVTPIAAVFRALARSAKLGQTGHFHPKNRRAVRSFEEDLDSGGSKAKPLAA